MEIAKIEVDNVVANIVEKHKIPVGIIGATISVNFKPSWTGLTKTAVFRSNGDSIVQEIQNESVIIPSEIVSQIGSRIWIGFYGVNSNDTTATPTLWADVGIVQDAASPDGDPATDPSLPVWSEVDSKIGHLDDLRTEQKGNLVESNNELFDKISTIDDAESDLANTVTEDRKASDDADKLINQSFAPAYKDTITGEIASTFAVSGVEHDVNTKIESINKLPFPYTAQTHRVNRGITFDTNPDGSIHIFGTNDGTDVSDIDLFARGNSIDLGIYDGVTVAFIGATSEDIKYTFGGIGYSTRYNTINKASYCPKYGDSPIFGRTIIQVNKNATVDETVYPIIVVGEKVPAVWTKYIQDYTAVTVSRCGGNIVRNKNPFGDLFEEIEPGLFQSVRPVTADDRVRINLPEGYFILSADFEYDAPGSIIRLATYFSDGTCEYSEGSSPGAMVHGSIATHGKKVTEIGWKFVHSGICRFKNWQIVASKSMKPYMEPIEAKEYIPSEDGTVLGVRSISPNMTLMTDTPGITISATYTTDTVNKVNFPVTQNAIDSLTNTTDLHTEAITQLQSDVLENADTITENRTNSDTELSRRAYSKDVAPGLRRTVSSNTCIIALDEEDAISPIEHEVEYKVENKNLIPYPYSSNDGVYKGVTITTENGKIHVNGTVDSSSGSGNFLLTARNDKNIFKAIKGKTISISGYDYGVHPSYLYMDFYKDDTYIASLNSGLSINTDIYDFNEINVVLYLAEGDVFNDVDIYPQIEIGTSSTSYTPYIPDFTAITVSRYGRNLIDDTISKSQFTIPSGGGFVRDLGYLGSGPRTISIKTDNNYFTNTFFYMFQYKNGEWNSVDFNNGYLVTPGGNNTEKITFTISAEAGVKYGFWAYGGDTFNCVKRAQIEVGKVKHPIEIYKGVQNIIPSEDGTVSGITSLSPNMTILTDTPGLIATVTYTQDTLNKKNMPIDANSFSPAVKITESGTAIAADMVSPIEHDVDCHISRGNLIHKLTKSGTTTISGITFTVNPDLSITITGENTSESVVTFTFYEDNEKTVELPDGGWLNCFTGSALDDVICVTQVLNSEGNYSYISNGSNNEGEISKRDGKRKLFRVWCDVKAKTVLPSEGLTIYPMLTAEKSSTWIPIVPDLAAVTVSRFGGNLINPSSIELGGLAGGTGKPFTSNIRIRSPFIPVVSGMEVYMKIYGELFQKNNVFEYDANKNIIRQLPAGDISNDGKFMIQSGAFIRVAWQKSGGSEYTEEDMITVKESAFVSPLNKFAPYIEPVTYIPSADGTVSGIHSLSPAMTLLTDTPGVTITATYNADTEKFIRHELAPLEERIAALEAAATGV